MKVLVGKGTVFVRQEDLESGGISLRCFFFEDEAIGIYTPEEVADLFVEIEVSDQEFEALKGDRKVPNLRREDLEGGKERDESKRP